MFVQLIKFLSILLIIIPIPLLVGCQDSDSPITQKQSGKSISVENHLYFKENLPVKSIYVGGRTNFQEILDTLKKYGANAVVIDVKDDFGKLFPDLPVTYNKKNQFISNNNFKSLIQKLKENKIYTIARIVALRESIRDDLCIKKEDGSLMIDKEKMSWMDPKDERVLKYLEEICSAAIKIGFDEVQLDYVRFSSYFRLYEDEAKDHAPNRSRIDAINNLIDRIGTSVHKLGGKLSVCVFGCTIEGSVDTPDKKNQTEKSSEILGQDYIEIAKRADYICPMIYPSHYPKDTPCGIKDPDLEPYKTISICMKLSNNMINTASEKNLKAKIRPYLQAFTAKWLKTHLQYGKKEINDQIRAVLDSGTTEQWGLFHMAGRYP